MGTVWDNKSKAKITVAEIVLIAMSLVRFMGPPLLNYCSNVIIAGQNARMAGWTHQRALQRVTRVDIKDCSAA
jgi:hypothetical protein